MTIMLKNMVGGFFSVGILFALATVPFAYGLSLPEESSLNGVASWYSEEDPGILPTTANMEKFDDTQLTCAMWDVPFGTLLEVRNTRNGKSVIVRVNDRGPARRLVEEGRIIDLTKGAFSQIADLNEGLIPVEVRVVLGQADTVRYSP